MTQHDNTNRGAIWKNDDKQNDNHPDFKGSLNVNGVDYWVAAWKRKEGASAKAPALSFSVKPKEIPEQHKISEQAVAKIRRPDPISTGRHPNGHVGRDMDDDEGIPF